MIVLVIIFSPVVAYVEGRDEGDRGNSQQPLTQVILSLSWYWNCIDLLKLTCLSGFWALLIQEVWVPKCYMPSFGIIPWIFLVWNVRCHFKTLCSVTTDALVLILEKNPGFFHDVFWQAKTWGFSITVSHKWIHTTAGWSWRSCPGGFWSGGPSFIPYIKSCFLISC